MVCSGTLVRLPLSCWRGWLYERRWGFSTQTLGAWLGDRAKGLVIGALLTGLALVLLRRADPRLALVVARWSAAPGAAALTLVLSLFAPLLFERLFNRFGRSPDPGSPRSCATCRCARGCP